MMWASSTMEGNIRKGTNKEGKCMLNNIGLINEQG
jgi:hypothetical protein